MQADVRIASRGEAPAVAAVLAAAFAPVRERYTPEAYAATTPNAPGLAARWPEGPVWVAVVGGQVVGTVSAVRRGDDGYVRSMAVLPAARGRGVGRQLLAATESWARQEGLRRLTLSTTPFLHEAIRLYEATGFRRVPEGPAELRGTPLFTMAKGLA